MFIGVRGRRRSVSVTCFSRIAVMYLFHLCFTVCSEFCSEETFGKDARALMTGCLILLGIVASGVILENSIFSWLTGMFFLLILNVENKSLLTVISLKCLVPCIFHFIRLCQFFKINRILCVLAKDNELMKIFEQACKDEGLKDKMKKEDKEDQNLYTVCKQMDDYYVKSRLCIPYLKKGEDEQKN